MKLKLYHYSVETFQAADDELVGDYKNQYLVYEPYIICLQNHKNLFEGMLYMARYNQVCAENKGNRLFSYWVKDATEAVFEYIRTTEFPEDSASRIKGIYYCESIGQAVKYLTEDCIESWGRGITKIWNGFTSVGLPEPLFEECCGGIRVTMYRPKMPGSGNDASEIVIGADIDFTDSADKTKEKTKEKTKGKTKEKTKRDSKEEIMTLMENNPSITYEELMSELSMSKGAVEYAVRSLRQSGLIERVGPDKGGKWKVNR